MDSTLPFSPGHIAGSCNDYLPSGSTFARFLWNVHMLAANGMYVLIDNHSNWDTTVVDDYAAWIVVRPLLMLHSGDLTAMHCLPADAGLLPSINMHGVLHDCLPYPLYTRPQQMNAG